MTPRVRRSSSAQSASHARQSVSPKARFPALVHARSTASCNPHRVVPRATKLRSAHAAIQATWERREGQATLLPAADDETERRVDSVAVVVRRLPLAPAAPLPDLRCLAEPESQAARTTAQAPARIDRGTGASNVIHHICYDPESDRRAPDRLIARVHNGGAPHQTKACRRPRGCIARTVMELGCSSGRSTRSAYDPRGRVGQDSGYCQARDVLTAATGTLYTKMSGKPFASAK